MSTLQRAHVGFILVVTLQPPLRVSRRGVFFSSLRGPVCFAFVGAVGYGLSLTVLHLLTPCTGHACAYPPAWLVAATWTYLANRKLTFACSHPPGVSEWMRWLVAQATGGIAGWLAFSGLVILGDAPAALALAISALCGALCNYVLGTRAVAKRRK